MGEACFASCRALRDIELSTHLNNLGPYCFNACLGLKRVRFKTDVPWLGEEAFMAYGGEYCPEAFVPLDYLDNYHNSEIRHYFYQIHGYE